MALIIITLMILVVVKMTVVRINNTKLINSAKAFLNREEKKGSFRATCELDALRGANRREALRRARIILVCTNNYRVK